MSATWQCHYRKNKPGYPNQFQICGDEIQHMLICSDPLFTKPINIDAKAYYPPLGPGGQLYRNVSGLFMATGTTGTSLTPVPNANVHVSIIGYDGHGGNYAFVNKDMLSDKDGVVSGLFMCSGGKTMVGVSGFISYLSGTLTGYLTINNTISDMQPSQFFDLELDASANTIAYDIDNPINVDNITVNVLRAENTARTVLSNVYSVTLSAFGRSPLQTQSIPLTHGYIYKTSYTPPYSNKPIESEFISGGAPPPFSGFQLQWSGNAPGGATLYYSPWLRILFDSNYDGWQDFYPSLEYKQTGSSTWGSFTISDRASGYWLSDLSSLTDAAYDFKASGCHHDSFGQCFYSSLLSGRVTIRDIQLEVTQAQYSCGLDLIWRGPQGGGYTIQIALDSNISVGVSNIPTDANAYFHDTSSTCGQIYYYRILQGTNSSNVASGSGIFVVPPAKFVLTQLSASGLEIEWGDEMIGVTSVSNLSGTSTSLDYTGLANPIVPLSLNFGDNATTISVPVNATQITAVEVRLYSLYGSQASYDYTNRIQIMS